MPYQTGEAATIFKTLWEEYIPMLMKLKRHQFLFEELVKRDFAKKYKRTILGMAWSILSPLLNLLIMWLVFNNFFGKFRYFLYRRYIHCIYPIKAYTALIKSPIVGILMNSLKRPYWLEYQSFWSIWLFQKKSFICENFGSNSNSFW